MMRGIRRKRLLNASKGQPGQCHCVDLHHDVNDSIECIIQLLQSTEILQKQDSAIFAGLVLVTLIQLSKPRIRSSV